MIGYAKMKLIDATWGRLNGTWKLVVVVGGSLLLLLLLWLYAATTLNHLDNWWNQRRTEAAQKQIDTYRQQAAEAKQVAEQALAELAAEKRVTAEERAKREVAEKVLTDKTLTANEKLKAYEKAINQPLPISTPDSNTDNLCQRAAALGISCGN